MLVLRIWWYIKAISQLVHVIVFLSLSPPAWQFISIVKTVVQSFKKQNKEPIIFLLIDCVRKSSNLT